MALRRNANAHGHQRVRLLACWRTARSRLLRPLWRAIRHQSMRRLPVLDTCRNRGECLMKTWTDTNFTLDVTDQPCVTSHKHAVSLHLAGYSLESRGFCIKFLPAHLP